MCGFYRDLATSTLDIQFLNGVKINPYVPLHRHDDWTFLVLRMRQLSQVFLAAPVDQLIHALYVCRILVVVDLDKDKGQLVKAGFQKRGGDIVISM